MEIVRSELLSAFPELMHGFSTKAWGNMSYRRDADGRADSNNREFLSAMGCGTNTRYVLDPCLNHGNTIAWLEPSLRTGHVPVNLYSPEVKLFSFRKPILPPDPAICPPDDGIDACWTDVPGALLTMRPADCAVVYMYDPKSGCVGMAHAGTAGIFSGIVTHAIESIQRWHNVKPYDLRCYIAPSVSAQAYDLRSTGAWKNKLHTILTSEQAAEYNPKARISNQLIACGVLPEHVEVSLECTASDPERFYSHSRGKSPEERAAVGRMLAVIGVRK